MTEHEDMHDCCGDHECGCDEDYVAFEYEYEKATNTLVIATEMDKIIKSQKIPKDKLKDLNIIVEDMGELDEEDDDEEDEDDDEDEE